VTLEPDDILMSSVFDDIPDVDPTTNPTPR
jgi:hypothetical protein